MRSMRESGPADHAVQRVGRGSVTVLRG